MHKFHRYNAIARTTMLISFAFAATLFTRSCDRKASRKKTGTTTHNEQTMRYNEALADALTLAFREKPFGNTLDDMSLEDLLQGVDYLQATVDDLENEDTEVESIDDNLRAFFEIHGTGDILAPEIAFAKIIPTTPCYQDEPRQQCGKKLTETMTAMYTTAFQKCKERFIAAPYLAN